MNAAASRGLRKGVRTLVQTIAGGGLTALVTVLAGGLSPQTSVLLMAMFTAIAALAQNYLETGGQIPTLLPSPGLVIGPVAETVATVDAVVDSTGDIVGDVLDTSGDIIGEITGQTDDDHERGALSVIVLVVLAVLIIVGGFAVCDLMFEDESEPGDNHLLGRVELVSHEYDDGGGYEGDYEDGDGGGGQNYEDQWSNEDRNRNRNRNRGAFSPGPFDDSPVDAFNGNTICLPGSTCYGDRGDEPPPDEREMR